MNPIKMNFTALRMFWLVIAGIGIASAAPKAIPTFHCMSLEWPQTAGNAATVCAVDYRIVGAGSWTTGHPLMWDGTEQQYRGSVVGLAPGTSYEFRLAIPGQTAVSISKSTWTETFPIATETVLPAGMINATYLINNGGSPSGWKVYKAHPSGTTIDVSNAQDYCVDIQASFVILKGVTMRNAKIHGMRIGNFSDVVVEGCDIANWGRPQSGTSNPVLQVQLDSGIYAEGANSQRLVFQGNKIGPPRYTANDWTQHSPYFGDNHPQGAKAIYLKPSLVGGVTVQGNHVIRWNDIAGDPTHMFNDLLFESDGSTNPSPGNGLARDSDIYGNNLSWCVDDGIELERGTRNIRVWDNYFDRAGIKALSVRSPWHGPYYIFRNVFARPHTVANPSLLPQTFFSENYQFLTVGFGRGTNGYPSTSPDGPKERGMGYFYHNTMLGIPGESFNQILQKPNSATPTGNTPADTYYRLRNNIWQTEKFRLPVDYAIYQIPSATPYIDYDLKSGAIDGAGAAGAHLITGTAIFAAGSPAAIAGTGNYQPAANCPGVNQGEVLHNFNDDYTGGAPDLGAMELGSSAFVTGRSLLVSAIGEIVPAASLTDNATVKSSAPTASFANLVNISAVAGDQRTALLKFTVTGLTAGTSVSGVSLCLQESTRGSAGNTNFTVYTTATSNWSESSVTWNNKPATATQVGSFSSGAIAENAVITIPLSANVVSGNGTVSLMLVGTSGTTDTQFVDKLESSVAAAQLLIETTTTTHAVTYNANGATGGTVPTSQTKTQDVPLTLATNTGNLTCTGFTFVGWNTAADGRGTSYAEGFSYTANATVTLYAKWTPAPGINGLEVGAEADAYVSEAAASVNYGGTGNISLLDTPGARRYALLRFQVQGLGGVPVNSVFLELTEDMSANDASVGFEVRQVTGAWAESTVTWANKPALGTTVRGTFTPVTPQVFAVPSTGQVMAAPDTLNGMQVRVSLDPSWISGDGTYELALVPVGGAGSGGDMALYSKEEAWSAARPRLVINKTSAYTGASDIKTVATQMSEYVLRKGLPDRNYDDPFYSNVLSYYGVLCMAAPDVANLPSLVDRVIAEYQPYLSTNYQMGNLDGGVMGIVPLEIFRQRGGQAYQDKGLAYANAAFSTTLSSGVSSMTRWWIDDMFMLGALEANAYLSSGSATYANNAGNQMVLEAERCQQANGLAWHRNDVGGTPSPRPPYQPHVSQHYWGRGNGWMAAGMTRTLLALPEAHPRRVVLLEDYRRHMAALKLKQNASGLWHQLLDRPDSYQETSATALFVYAMAYGIQQGWLARADYEPVVTLAWDALARHIQAHGRVTDIAWGGPSRAWTAEDYMNWPQVEGDNHGQGTVLLAAEAMLRLTSSNITYEVTYDANNATSGTTPSAQTKTHGAPLSLATNSGSLARAGYTFVGWNTEADGSGMSYSSGGIYLTNAALTLYAKWVLLTPLYWDNTGGTAKDWGSVANWSTIVGGGTNPGALPGASDVATFSATPIQGTAQTINLNDNRSSLGLNVLSGVTTATTLASGGAARTLTLGVSGITNAGSGAVSIGSTSGGTAAVNIILAGSQSIANNGTGKITIFNAVTGTGIPTLTNTGTGTGAVEFQSPAAINSSVSKIVQDSATSALGLRCQNPSFSGGVEVKQGTLSMGNHGTNLGTGSLTLGGSGVAAMLSVQDNNNVSFNNPIVLDSGNLTIRLIEDNGTSHNKTFTGGITGSNSLTIENNGGNDTITFSTGALNNAGTITHIGSGSGVSTINSVIGMNVTGVIQNSATSKLALTGTNTYTGDTTVSAGTLVIDGDAIPNTGKLVIDGGKVDPSGATETVSTLFFGAVQQVAGTWGSESSTATHKTNAYFTGTGVVFVSNGPGFSNWLAANSTAGNLSADHDNDGVANGVEWFLRGNANTTGFTALPAVSNTSITWIKSADYPGTYGNGFRVETSNTLADPWTPAALGVGPGMVEITGNTVKFTFPTGVKYFARLVVTGP